MDFSHLHAHLYEPDFVFAQCPKLGPEDIDIIQGDDYDISVTLVKDNEIINPELVSNVYLSCVGADYVGEFTFDTVTSQWVLHISSTESDKFNIGIHTYDVTTVFTESGVQTQLYSRLFVVRPKHYPQEGEDY